MLWETTRPQLPQTARKHSALRRLVPPPASVGLAQLLIAMPQRGCSQAELKVFSQGQKKAGQRWHTRSLGAMASHWAQLLLSDEPLVNYQLSAKHIPPACTYQAASAKFMFTSISTSDHMFASSDASWTNHQKMHSLLLLVFISEQQQGNSSKIAIWVLIMIEICKPFQSVKQLNTTLPQPWGLYTNTSTKLLVSVAISNHAASVLPLQHLSHPLSSLTCGQNV